MSAALPATVLFFPVYLAIRATYARLPLHIDTGYYVSNHTIATGRWRFAPGWNARYAGCSKLIPEAIFSLIFLATRRHATAPMEAGRTYVRWARLAMSLVNFASAVLVGLLAKQWLGGSDVAYITGLLAYGMLASEPHYGAYFECAESFEVPFQTLAMLLASVGLTQHQPWLIGAAAGVWCAEAFFVKLSSAPAAAIVLAALCIAVPTAIMPVAAASAFMFALYLVWCRHCGQCLSDWLKPLHGHESSFDRRGRTRDPRHRFVEKLRRLTFAASREFLIPLLALLGLAISGLPWLFVAYAVAVSAAYVIQATDCRYYLIPLLPLLAIPAAGAATVLIAWSPWFGAVLGVILLMWIYRVALRPWSWSLPELNRRCWEGQRSAVDAARNLQLVDAAITIAPQVDGRSLLAYGPFSQAYVLCGAAFDTPIIVPDGHLDDMAPDWQTELNRRVIDRPPAFVLDTDRCFDAHAARSGLGLDYRLVQRWGDWLRLYELRAVDSSTSKTIDAVRTFRPMSGDELAREDAALPDDAAEGESCRSHVHERSVEPVGGLAASALNDPVAEQITSLLAELAEAGVHSIALFGAGRFTARYIDLYRKSPVPVRMVIDDRPERHGGSYLGWPVRQPDDVHPGDVDAVIISTDRFVDAVARRAAEQWGDALPVFRIDRANVVPRPFQPLAAGA